MKPARDVGVNILITLATVCLGIAVFAVLMGFFTWFNVL